jgi:hypothetical protein
VSFCFDIPGRDIEAELLNRAVRAVFEPTEWG